LLAGFAARPGSFPVQVTVNVWPIVDGTVMLSVAGVDAQLKIPSDAPMEQRTKAPKMRGLKESGFRDRVIFLHEVRR